MVREPCSELAGGDMSKDIVKKDKKKKKERKKKEEEAEMKGQKQKFDTSAENLVMEGYEVEGKQSSEPKKSKRKRNDAGEASAGDQVVKREDKKRKKKHPVVLEQSSQKQTYETTVENLVIEGDKVEVNQSSKSKKSKHKCDDAGEASAGNQVVTREDKKRKKKHPVVLEESSQKQTLDTTIENLVTEGDKVEVKQSSKSKKSKHKCDGAGEASAGNQVVTKEDKKRKKKHPVFLEESSQKQTLDTTIENSVVEGDKVEGKESSKSKEDNKRKNKGKRVSFADSTIVFRTEGGDSDGIEGGKKKKRKAAQSKNKGKRVSFADSAEVLSIEGGDDEGGDRSDESKFVHGQRFTPEEDATLLQAIRDFIEMKQLGEKGFEMIFSSKEHKLRGCWPIIGKSLPNRPKVAIYSRARTLLSRSAERKWTKEEKDYIRQFVAKNGTDWMTLARELGKCNIHVKDTWRRIKSENLKKGMECAAATNLTYLDEQQKLFDLVNLDLRMKAHQNKNPDNRKLKDNISWEAISDKLTTRNHKNCCIKWYDSLASPMVKEGIWADVDDYLLVEALQKDDAVCVEDVDWDSLLDDRSGELCRRRWNQMVRALGGHRERAFIEQVDVLSKRYCPEMIEYRKPKE